MAAPLSTTTSLSDILPQIVAEALFVASERSIMRGLVKNYTVPFNSGTTIKVPVYDTQTAVGLSEGADIIDGTGDVEVTANSGKTLTVSEVGLGTIVTDLAMNTGARNVIADVGRLFGEAIARKMDQDLTALFSGFSNSVGDASTIITVDDFFLAAARLKNAAVPMDGVVAVVSNETAYDLTKLLTSTGNNTYQPGAATDVANAALNEGFIGKLAGIPVYESSNVATKGAIFHRDALGLAMLQDIKLETQRDASRRGDEVIGTAVYGVGEIRDEYGRYLNVGTSFTAS